MRKNKGTLIALTIFAAASFGIYYHSRETEVDSEDELAGIAISVNESDEYKVLPDVEQIPLETRVHTVCAHVEAALRKSPIVRQDMYRLVESEVIKYGIASSQDLQHARRI